MITAGFDIGGTKCAAVLAETDGNTISIVAREEYPTKGSWQSIADNFCRLLTRMAAARGLTLKDIFAVGISCGGPLDAAAGMILSPPNLSGWDNVPITEYIKKKTSIEARLLNDADACAVAEWRYGAGKGCRNFIFMTFGTGLGAGLILNGQLYSGTNNMAGEAGHIRLSGHGPVGYGKRGSFEGFCSGNGIRQQAVTYFTEKLQAGIASPLCANEEDLSSLSAKKLGKAAEEGDPDALFLFAECGRYLGQGLSVLVDILNPEVIALGGIYMRMNRFIEPSMLDVLQRECLNRSRRAVKILPAALCEQIGDFGAVVAGLYTDGKIQFNNKAAYFSKSL